MSAVRALFLCALALPLAGSATAAPDRIEVPESQAWSTTSGEVSGASWWNDFGDPGLAEVVDAAVANNGDAQAAFERVRMASGVQVQQFSALLPRASFDLGVSTGPYLASFCQQIGQAQALNGLLEALANDPQSLLNNPGGGGTDQALCTSTSAMLNASWQLDVFGRQSLSLSSQTHELEATRADRDSALLQVSTVVAEAWYDVRTAEQQVALLERQLTSQEELLELIELRYEQGGASGLDVLQQRQQVASTAAMLPGARANRDARKRQLAAFLGRDLEALPSADGPLPPPAELPGVGSPSEVVASRPDLVAAEHRAKGARDARASAQTGLLPTLSAQANAGWNGFFDPDVNEPLIDTMTGTERWSAGLSLSIPLFNGGLTHGRIRQARAAESMAVHQYNQAVRNAVAEVDGAIRLDEEQRLRLEAVETQAEAARLTYEESVQRYLEGLDPYLNVLTSQAGHQAAELTLLQARRDTVGARIQLHDALGQIASRQESP